MLHPTSLPQEQAPKNNMASMVRIQVFSNMHSCDGMANTSIWLIIPMKLEKPGKILQLLCIKEMAYT